MTNTIDWTKSMQQTYEYYTVDPGTWMTDKLVDTITSGSISWDRSAETLGSASFDITESLTECYIRPYLVAIQNGITAKFPLGTFLVQTPGRSFDGKTNSITMDAYTPLLELKENPPELGFSIAKGENIMDNAYKLVSEHVRAPVVKPSNDKTLYSDFVANTDDTWLTFNSDLIANANYSFALDELSRILFAPDQETAALQPVYTFDDGNSSILYPEISVNRDLYGVPNVVEVVYSQNNRNFYARAENNDTGSPISIPNRGREIIYRVTDPNLAGNSTQAQIAEYATKLLKELSTLEYTVSYIHGYCGNRVNDCVLLNYTRAGIVNVKARVISQTIKLEPGCPVSEQAVYTKTLWGE